MDLTDFARNRNTRTVACQLLGHPGLADPTKEVDFLKLVAEYHLRFIAPVDENGVNDGIVGVYASDLPAEIGSNRFQPIIISSNDISCMDTLRNSSLSIFQLPTPCTKELITQVIGKITDFPATLFSMSR